MNALPTTCLDFVSHPHKVQSYRQFKDEEGNLRQEVKFVSCYRCQEANASEEQGTTAIAKALRDLGIKADVHQTGGFTMCVYIDTAFGSYIYANAEGFSFYKDENCDGWAHYEFKEMENTPEKKAQAISETMSVVFVD